MSGYNTKQRRALLAFLGEHPDELLTARQMAAAQPWLIWYSMSLV